MPERVVWLRSCSGTSRVRGLVSTIVSSVRAYPLGGGSTGERRGGPVRVDAALGQVGDELRVVGQGGGDAQLEAFGGERLHLRQQSRAPEVRAQPSCSSTAAHTTETSPVVAATESTGGSQSRFGPRCSICRSSRTTSAAPSRSALLTTKTSATSRIPAFAICTASPRPGASRTTVVSVAAATSTSA